MVVSKAGEVEVKEWISEDTGKMRQLKTYIRLIWHVGGHWWLLTRLQEFQKFLGRGVEAILWEVKEWIENSLSYTKVKEKDTY